MNYFNVITTRIETEERVVHIARPSEVLPAQQVVDQAVREYSSSYFMVDRSPIDELISIMFSWTNRRTESKQQMLWRKQINWQPPDK